MPHLQWHTSREFWWSRVDNRNFLTRFSHAEVWAATSAEGSAVHKNILVVVIFEESLKTVGSGLGGCVEATVWRSAGFGCAGRASSAICLQLATWKTVSEDGFATRRALVPARACGCEEAMAARPKRQRRSTVGAELVDAAKNDDLPPPGLGKFSNDLTRAAVLMMVVTQSVGQRNCSGPWTTTMRRW